MGNASRVNDPLELAPADPAPIIDGTTYPGVGIGFRAMLAKFRAATASPSTRLAALFLAATLVLTWPLIFNLSSHAINTGDPFFISHIMKANIDAVFGRVALPDLPFFFPHDNAYFFSEPYIGPSILVFPFALFTGDPIALYNIGILLGFFLNGFGTALLVRRLTQNAAAAVWAGLFFAFLPYKFNQIEHIHVFSTEGLPLFLWATHRWLASKGWRAALIPPLFLALQAHAGMVLAVFWYLPVGALWLWILVTTQKNERRRVFLQLVAQGALFLALVLPVLIPMALVHHDLAIVRQASEIAEFSASPINLLGAPAHNLLYGKWLASNQEAETALFIGFLAMLLVLVALIRRPAVGTRRVAVISATFAVLYVLIAFGPNIRFGESSVPGPYRILQAVVPGFDSVRTPARAFAIGALGFAIAGAFGCVRLAELAKSRRRLAATLPWIACAVTALEFFSVVPWENIEAHKSLTAIDKAVAALPGRDPVVYFPVKPNRFGPGVLNRELFLTYHQAALQRPVVNGYSGFFPEFHRALEQSFINNSIEEMIPVLAAFGVRWFVYDPNAGDLFLRKRAAKVIARIAGLKKRAEIDGLTLYEIEPVAPATTPPKIALKIPSGQPPGGKLVVEIQFKNEAPAPIAERRGRPLRLAWTCGDRSGESRRLLQPFWVPANDERSVEVLVAHERTAGTHRCKLRLLEHDTEMATADLATTIGAREPEGSE